MNEPGNSPGCTKISPPNTPPGGKKNKSGKDSGILRAVEIMGSNPHFLPGEHFRPKPLPPLTFEKALCCGLDGRAGSPAEWTGQNSPGTNPFDSAKKGTKKGNHRERARSQARSKERPLPDSAKRPALPSGPGKARKPLVFWGQI